MSHTAYEHQAVDHDASIRAERPDPNGFVDQVRVTITHGEDEPTSITMWAEDFEAMAREVRPGPTPDAERVQGDVTAVVEPYLVEWATEVDDHGTKEIWDSEAEARAEAKYHGQRLFRIEWTEIEA